MEACPNPGLNEPHYFLLHHGVLKAYSSTKKFIVVFGASSKTIIFLNDILLTGLKLQNNICTTLLHFKVKYFLFHVTSATCIGKLKYILMNRNFN